VHPIQLIRMNVFGPEPCRGLPEVPGVEGHTRDREARGVRAEVAPLQVFEVPVTSGCQHRLLFREDHGVGEPHDPPSGSLLASRRDDHPTGACHQMETGGAQERSKARRTGWGGTDPHRVARRCKPLCSTAQRLSPTTHWSGRGTAAVCSQVAPGRG
jgi:hypothetical protein